MSKQALYHQDSKAPLLLAVLKSNKNGTVDLGLDGVVKVSECEIADDATPGSCTLIKEPKAKAAKTEESAEEEGKAAEGE